MKLRQPAAYYTSNCPNYAGNNLLLHINILNRVLE